MTDSSQPSAQVTVIPHVWQYPTGMATGICSWQPANPQPLGMPRKVASSSWPLVERARSSSKYACFHFRPVRRRTAGGRRLGLFGVLGLGISEKSTGPEGPAPKQVRKVDSEVCDLDPCHDFLTLGGHLPQWLGRTDMILSNWKHLLLYCSRSSACANAEQRIVAVLKSYESPKPLDFFPAYLDSRTLGQPV